jgi:hypothetical protein
LEKPAGSIFRAGDGRQQAPPKHWYIFIKLQRQKSHFPENSNIKTKVTQKPRKTQILTHLTVTTEHLTTLHVCQYRYKGNTNTQNSTR